VVEKRTKLREQYLDLPQEKLRELKERGVEITRSMEIPLIAYTGDTAPGPHLIREDVRKAQIVIAECTFFEPDHKSGPRSGCTCTWTTSPSGSACSSASTSS